MKFAKLLAFAAVLGMAGLAMAAEDAPKRERKARPKGIMGKIVSVDTGAKTVTIAKRTRGKKETTSVTILTNDETNITIDRIKNKAVADLTKGMSVFITPETASKTEVAKTIRAWTKRPERKRKPKEGDTNK